MKPIYEHDCDCCTFLGNFTDEFETYDLYHCAGGFGPTVVGRYDNEGSKYISGMVFAIHAYENNEPGVWLELYKRAKAKGLSVSRT
jgi:hypothetical protein